MRLYIYLNKDIIKCIAAELPDVSFNIDFFEYSEKKAYSTNNNMVIRPEIENWDKKYGEKKECFDRGSLDVSNERGNLCNFEVVKRYINIEDISSIKNNSFFYTILKKIPCDDRIKEAKGRISELKNNSFTMNNNKYIINSELYEKLVELYENACDVVVIGYKINCLSEERDVFKVMAIYIE